MIFRFPFNSPIAGCSQGVYIDMWKTQTCHSKVLFFCVCMGLYTLHASPTEQECCFSLISALFSFIISNPLSHSRQLGWSVGQGYFPRHCAQDLPWFLLASAATWLSLTPFSTPRWLTPTASPVTARAARALTMASPMEEPGTQWAEVRISGFVDMFCLALKGIWSKEKQQQNLSVGIEWERDGSFFIFSPVSSQNKSWKDDPECSRCNVEHGSLYQ